MPILLNRSQIESLLSMEDALGAAREAFLALAREQAVLPQRVATRVEAHSGTHLTMPCFVRTEAREVLCTKLVTVFEKNPARGLSTTLGFLTLQDAETGELLALMDAEFLTALRTAAASAVAVDLMGVPNAETMTLFGVGGQAESHLRAVCSVRPIKRAYVVARRLERAEEFCQKHPGDVELVPTEDRRAAVSSSQVICTTTNSLEPVFEGSWLQDGAVVAAVGAFRPDMREVDEATVSRSFVAVDRLEAARNGAGDLIQASVDWDRVVALGELLADPSRVPSDGRPRLFKSVGLAVQDAFVADVAYRRALERGMGTEFELG